MRSSFIGQSRPVVHGSRYELLTLIAHGGMASVYVGRLAGAEGFSRLVAIKRAHEHVAADPGTRRLIAEEARLASKLHHPNVVAVQDVEQLDEGLLLVMDYVEGPSLAHLIMAANKAGAPLDVGVAIRIALDTCAGLSAAHELTDELGVPMPLVHRDVSPQNILVGLDGVARLTDFGIAKSVEGPIGAPHSGALRGKVAYMAPEYIEGNAIDGRADQFALGVVIWEVLANQRLFQGETEAQTMRRVLDTSPSPLHETRNGIPKELDTVIRRALAKEPNRRFPTLGAFSAAVEAVCRQYHLVADPKRVATAVQRICADEYRKRREVLREILSAPQRSQPRLSSLSGPPTPFPPVDVGSPTTQMEAATVPIAPTSKLMMPRWRPWLVWGLAGLVLTAVTMWAMMSARTPSIRSEYGLSGQSRGKGYQANGTGTASTRVTPPVSATSAPPIPSTPRFPGAKTGAKPSKPAVTFAPNPYD